MPDRVLRAIDFPTMDHRGPEFADLGKACLEGMKKVFQTKAHVVIYPASGTGAWEAALVNTLSPGDAVYEGMVVGECARENEMVVNVVRAKEKNNIRTHSHDDAVKLAAPVVHTLETAIEWIADDELVEVTPKNIRLRKRILASNMRPKKSDD